MALKTKTFRLQDEGGMPRMVILTEGQNDVIATFAFLKDEWGNVYDLISNLRGMADKLEVRFGSPPDEEEEADETKSSN